MKSSRSQSIKLILIIVALALLAGLGFYAYKHHDAIWESIRSKGSTVVSLPAASVKGTMSLEEAIVKRQSASLFKAEPISVQQLSQLLWAAQGVTSKGRTAPSAGALYPLDLYVIAGNVKDLPPGIYRYLPMDNSLELLQSGDKRKELATAVHEPKDISAAAALIVIAANPVKTQAKYGSRGQRFVYLETGHATENLLLQAAALGLGTVAIGGFEENTLQLLMNLPKEEEALYIVPVGKI